MKLLNNNIPMLFALLALAITAVVSSLEYSRDDFPSNFVFGSGTSAYQVEGAADEDGRAPSIWDVYANGNSGVAADVSCDQYHKYKEDVKLMAAMGLEAYRFSISWSRLLPSGRGPVNPKGLQYYNNLIDELVTQGWICTLSLLISCKINEVYLGLGSAFNIFFYSVCYFFDLAGIQPHVTLHHFDLPQVLEDEYGGWLSQEIVRDFTAYADICFMEFGDRVLHWNTINEVNVFAIGGYDTGITPPARCSPPFGQNCSKGNSSIEPYIVVHNMLLAHASAANLYKEKYKYKQHGSIGISVYTFGAAPLTKSVEDKLATARFNDFYIGWILHPLVFGDYPETMKINVGSRLPTFTEEESEQVKGALDFVGVINYLAVYVKESSSSLKPNLPNFETDLAVDLNVVGNISPEDEYPITPWCLQEVLLYIKETYGNPPVYILENGQRTPKNSSLDDTKRIDYLSSYIEAVLHSLRKGTNVKGYFQWSLMDLYELFGGYERGFGLYYVDFKDPYLKRIPKLSAHWYSSFLKGTLYQAVL